MSNDPKQPWSQPTAFDPQTGQPIYGGQQPQYPQQPQQQPYPQQPQPYPQQPQPYPQQPQPYPQQPQQGYAQPYAQQPEQPQYPQQPQGYPPQYGQQPQQPQYPQYPQQGYVQHPQGYPQQAPLHPPQPTPQPAPASNYPKQLASYGGYGPVGGHLQREDSAHDVKPKLRAKANATIGKSDRVRFIRHTYVHLFGAMAAFAGLLWMLFKVGFLANHISRPLIDFAIGGARWHWAVVLVVFMAVSWVADYWARHATSRAMQYVGLGCYVVAEALIFVPLLAIVQWKTASIIARGGSDPNILRDSGVVTLVIFGALTASVFFSKKDFSFLRSGLAMASAGAMMLIVLSIVFGFNLGIVFSIAMVLLAAGYILYQTSQVFAHYHTEQYVAAALALFSSVALMFWYVIRIFMRARD